MDEDMNLLLETIDKITEHGKTPKDIIYIGDVNSGEQCTWEEFQILANRTYDSGYGAAEVNKKLCIVFNEGSWLERYVYDGAEWWVTKKPFIHPSESKPIKTLFGSKFEGTDDN